VGLSGFQILSENSGAFNIDDELLTADLDIPETAANNVTIIQVQIETDQASILEVTTNSGTSWSKLNNGTAIDGMATFTMMMRAGDLLNFRNTDVAGLAVKITVAG